MNKKQEISFEGILSSIDIDRWFLRIRVQEPKIESDISNLIGKKVKVIIEEI